MDSSYEMGRENESCNNNATNVLVLILYAVRVCFNYILTCNKDIGNETYILYTMAAIYMYKLFMAYLPIYPTYRPILLSSSLSFSLHHHHLLPSFPELNDRHQIYLFHLHS